MTQYLPPNLLALFAPRDPIPYMTPLDKLPHEKKLTAYRGVADFLQEFEDPKDTPPPTRVETKDEKRERKRKERQEQVAYQLEQDLALWDPSNDPTIAGDAFKTLFVGRINYDTSESKLRREFEVYGPVKRLKMVYNNQNASHKPRGYAFIEYEHERDMHSAYKHADGKKIDGRRVLVDVERGRTIKGWRPRRLAGGLGGTRKGGPDVNTKFSGREDGSSVQRDDRSRSRERDRRGRRSRSRDRRGRRSRSPRDRKPPRPRSRDRGRREGEDENIPFDQVEVKIEGRKRRRSRSRDRGGERRRSRSRERRRRSRSPRGDRKRRRSRDRDRGRGDGDENGMVRVKEEKGPVYPGEDENYGMANNYGPAPPMEGPPPPPAESYGNGASDYAAPPPPVPPVNEYGSYQQQ